MNSEMAFEDRFSRLQHALRKIQAPTLEHFRPGHSEGSVDELLASVDLMIPPTLRAWWRWHDGSADPGIGRSTEREIAPGGWLHISLAESLEVYAYHEEMRRAAAALGDDEVADLTWSSSLAPFAYSVGGMNDVLAIDTAKGDSVVRRGFMGLEFPPLAIGFADVVEAWAAMLESGEYAVIDGAILSIDDLHIEDDPVRRWLT